MKKFGRDAISAAVSAACALVGLAHATEVNQAPRATFTTECRDKDGNLKWTDVSSNLVVTQGKNDLLDKYLSGSGYTAAWYCGLISSISYTNIVAADTAASHGGWTEAGATNAPNYTGNRPALVFGAASAGSKATSSASSFTFTSNGTIKGMFASSVATKDATTGVLYNAVLFSGGDRAVLTGDVVNVSVTYSA